MQQRKNKIPRMRKPKVTLTKIRKRLRRKHLRLPKPRLRKKPRQRKLNSSKPKKLRRTSRKTFSL